MADVSHRKHASIVKLHQYNQASSRDISKKIGLPQPVYLESLGSTKLQGQSVKNGRRIVVVKGRP